MIKITIKIVIRRENILVIILIPILISFAHP